MHTNWYKYLIAFILAFPTFTMAQGFQVNFQGQAQQGMGGAGGALPQDASILFFNPGAASFYNSNEISVGMTPTISRGSFLENNTNEVYNTSSPVGTPFTAYGLFQIKDSSRLKLGLAVYTPFGSTVEWEEGWTGRFALTRLKLLSVFFQPTVSFRITKKIGIGAGFVYGYGNVNLQKDLPLQDADGNYGHAELSGNGQGFGFNVGLYFEPIKQLSIGVTYRSQVNMKLKNGEADFTVPQSLEGNFPDGKFTSSIPLPSVISLSVAVKPTEKLAILLDANYVDWTAYDTLAFDYENNTSSLSDTRSAREYKGTITIRAGAQYKFTEKIIGRLGLAFATTPVQEGYVTPETPDNNRLNYTIGIGYKVSKKLQLDASLLYTQVQREDTNLETGLSGKYKMRVFAPGLSIAYKF